MICMTSSLVSCRPQVTTFFVMMSLAGLASAFSSCSAIARTMSRSDRMPLTASPSVTTTAPIFFFARTLATLAILSSGRQVVTVDPFSFNIH